METVGVILAGGLSRRLGRGDKTLLPLGDTTVLGHVIARLTPQVDRLVLNANGDARRFEVVGLPVVPDTVAGFAGPLAGVLAGMEWAKDNTQAQAIVTVAGDTPFFPPHLVARLVEASDGRHVSVARSDGRLHPVFVRWPLSLRDDLAAFLADGRTLRVATFLDRIGYKTADFEITEAGDPFFNINTEADLAAARARIASEAR